MGNEFGAAVGRDVGRNSVFGEDVEKEELSEFFGVAGGVGGYEDRLLGKAVHYDQDGVMSAGVRELIDEVH